MAEEMRVVTIARSGKKVRVPVRLLADEFDSPVEPFMAARQFAVQSGQATQEEAFGVPAEKAGVSGPLEAALISAGKSVSDIGSNIGQLFSDDPAGSIASQAESDRLLAPVSDEFPKSSFAGSILPEFAVPGGKFAQIGAGIAQGALEGDTALGRIGGGVLGGASGLVGQKVGDFLGAKVQNRLQKAAGNPNAPVRKELLDAKIPLTLSQRTDSPISKPLARFFERGKFVLTGRQPNSSAQQARITGLITEALGVDAKKLTRAGLGEAVESNRRVFQGAAQRIEGKVRPDDKMVAAADSIIDSFNRVGSDSKQVSNIFGQFEDFVSSPNGLDPDVLLKLRSQLSKATTKSDLETSAIVDAISAIDDRISREVPELASDLTLARDRFRLLLAIRRGSALSPQGDINVPTFTKNLERVFRNFDVGAPLPRSLRAPGEAIAGLNQITDGFRSSGTAENAAALALPGAAAIEPSAIVKALLGASAPFAGGGTGGLLGGGFGRSVAQSLIDAQVNEI